MLNKMKKILTHSPYWEVGAGGERYSLTVAESLQDIAEVFVTVSNKGLLLRLEDRLNLNLGKVKIFPKKVNTVNLMGMDGVFWVSDGSIPFLPVWNRIIHFQAPFKNVSGNSWKNKLKLFGTKIICNSKFTKNFIDKEYKVNSKVVYPPIETEKIHPLIKQNLILTVGRFSTSSQNKRPDLMIKTFKKMTDEGLKGWRLLITGIMENEESQIMVTALRTMSRGYPIAIKTDLTHEKIVELYGRASIYWHAAGFGTDLNKHPEKAEHFGISTVEAMAGGAVPIVFAAGGQLEIVQGDKNGMLWSTPEELISKTLLLINDYNKRKTLAENAVIRSRFFNKERFFKEIRGLFQ